MKCTTVGFMVCHATAIQKVTKPLPGRQKLRSPVDHKDHLGSHMKEFDPKVKYGIMSLPQSALLETRCRGGCHECVTTLDPQISNANPLHLGKEAIGFERDVCRSPLAPLLVRGFRYFESKE